MKTPTRIITALAAILILKSPHLRAEQEGAFTYSTKDKGAVITKYTGEGGEVKIPDTLNKLRVTAIAADAFIGNKFLTSVTIPEGVTSIGDTAFGDCPKLTKVSIPASATLIGNYVFRGCPGLMSFDVTAGNPNYSSADGVLFDKLQTTMLKYPAGKSGRYVIPDSVKSIGRAFSFSQGLDSLIFGKGLTSIENRALLGCANLTSVTLSESVTSIGDQAFVQSKKLESVTIPASVISIGSAAFAECSGLKSVNFKGNAPTLGEKVFALTAPDFGIRYSKGSTGFTSPTWNGYPAAQNK